jgi:glycosyltransferase involved in cell wall biosynthesis
MGLKVASVSLNRVGWGGSEQIWHRINLALRQSNFQVATLYFEHHDKTEAIKLQKEVGVTLIPLKANAYWQEEGSKAIWRTARKFYEQPNLDHPALRQMLDFNAGHYLFNLGELFEPDLPRFKTLVAYLWQHQIPYQALVHLVADIAPPVSPDQRNFWQKFYQRAAKLHFVSEANAQAAFRQLLQRPYSYQVLTTQVSHQLQLLELPPSNRLNLAMVARLEHEVKGQDLMIAALQCYPQKEKVRLNCYGKGESEPYLEELIAHYDLQELVCLKGFQSPRHIWQENHFALLASKWEGQPLAILEAMRFGRSFIAPQVGGLTDLPRDIGYHYDTADFDQLHQIWDALLAAPSEWTQKGQRAGLWWQQQKDGSLIDNFLPL